ncbi:hypothetical protein [Streptomyces lutosisoli]|uniref:Uncharacterized protein n=1 Tax=Streptomyces lutosisoli TaxID=2665721 RepID=A0ABW2VZL8_9ACTN
MPSLLDVLQCLDDQPAEAALFAAGPWTAASDAAVGVLDEPPHGLTCMLEAEAAGDVLDVWSSWRDGAEPNVRQKCQAVVHCAEHDAYLDVHR